MTAAGANTYAYDLNGNMISGAGKTIAWTGSNMVASMTKGAAPPKEAKGIAAVRAIFRNEKWVTVTDDGAGIISIRIGNPPDGILGTRISHVTFTPDEQYNDFLAIGAIKNTPEVGVAMGTLGISQTKDPFFRLTAIPQANLPHLPSSLEELTFDEALDTVARTFRSIVLYGACVKPPLYSTESVGGYNWSDSHDQRGKPPP